MNEIPYSSCKKLAEVLPLTGLTELNLSRNNFKNQGIIEIAQALRYFSEKTCVLERLNVSNCGL